MYTTRLRITNITGSVPRHRLEKPNWNVRKWNVGDECGRSLADRLINFQLRNREKRAYYCETSHSTSRYYTAESLAISQNLIALWDTLSFHLIMLYHLI